MTLFEEISELRQLIEGSLGERRRRRVIAAITKKQLKAGADPHDADDAAYEATKKFTERGRKVGGRRATPAAREAEREAAAKSTLASGSGESYMDRMDSHFKRQGKRSPGVPSGYFDRFKMSPAEQEKRREALDRLKSSAQEKKERPGPKAYTADDGPRTRAQRTSKSTLGQAFRRLTGPHYGDPVDASLWEAIFGESDSGRLFGKGGQKPGWKTIQQLRGAAASKRPSYMVRPGKRVGAAMNQWAGGARPLGRAFSKRMRTQDQKEIEDQQQES